MSATSCQDGNDGFAAFARGSADRPMNRLTPAPQPGIAKAALAQLTGGQKDCLRLVYNHMTSKDIARVLGVSPHTVDMRLRTAMKVLSVATRIDAARLLVRDENGGDVPPETYQSLIYASPDMAGPTGIGFLGSSASAAGDADIELDPARNDARQLLSPALDPLVNGPPREAGASTTSEAEMLGSRSGAGTQDPGSGARPLANSMPWGARNTLSVPARLAWIAGIAIGSALSFGAILSALQSLKSLI
jgi:DNA-binding CsgD family transcriptional regulator